MLTDIREQFERHEILLTGANGFLGKVVLGLILDRYPDFKHLHILLRPQRGDSAEARFFDGTLKSAALAATVEKFSRERGADFLRRKITAWEGDLAQPLAGLGESVSRLQGRLGLIINSAGLVEFFPPVDDSLRSNADGVENLVALARSTGAKLLHISTCFVCGAVDGLVEETEPVIGYYPRRRGPEDNRFNHADELHYIRGRIGEIYASANANGGAGEPRAAGREMTQRLVTLGRQRAATWGWVNTYTYTKALGEQVVAAAEGLECSIVRPAIVESALEFPIPGWIEGGRTAAPLVLMALGGMKDWPVRPEAALEVVPVDMVASAVLAVAGLLLAGRSEPVYQLGSGDSNPLVLEPLLRLLAREARKRPVNGGRPLALDLVDPPSGLRFLTAEQARSRRDRLQRRIHRAEGFVQRLQGALGVAHLPGRKSLAMSAAALRTLSLQTSFREQTLEQYLPFILHHAPVFESENIRTAYKLISELDRELLPWRPERIDWPSYWVDHEIRGIQKWVQPEAVREWAFKV